MDHSVTAYLERVPLEALEQFILQCEQTEDYPVPLQVLVEILTRRRNQEGS